MSNTKETVRVPRKVEVKLLLPYGAITLFIALFIGIVVGWQLRDNIDSQVKAEAATMIKSVSKTK